MIADWAVAADSTPASIDRGDLRVERARWSPDELARLVERLGERGPDALAAVPLARRLEAWREVAAVHLDPASVERARLLPPLLTTARLSPEGLSEALDVVVGGADGEAARALAERLPPLRRRAPALVVLAANVPGLVVQSLLPALLVGRPLLVKSSQREPLFAPAWIRALTAREPALADAFAAVSWPGSDQAALAAASAGADVVLAYGGAEAIATIARHCGDRLIAHGPRASVGLVAGEHDPLETGRALARDVALLDQRGCLSVHAVYVVGDARALAETLAFGLAGEHRRLPPGPVEAETAAMVHQLRGEADLRGALVGDLEVLQGSVLVADGRRFVPSPGMRLIRVHAVDALEEAIEALAHQRAFLQGAALAGRDALARGDEIAARLGVARIAPAGRLQHAEAGWAAGGLDPLAALA